MSPVSSACLEILNQLESTVEQIQPQDFYRPSSTLGGSTIGQHLRHTLEFFLCLEQGFEQGVINYDKRNHDKQIETDTLLAIATIGRIRDFSASVTENKLLELNVSYQHHSETGLIIPTNYNRELTYNIEHAIHHMAIMKIGIHEIAPYVNLPNHFGVAVSTVRYQATVQP